MENEKVCFWINSKQTVRIELVLTKKAFTFQYKIHHLKNYKGDCTYLWETDDFLKKGGPLWLWELGTIVFFFSFTGPFDLAEAKGI